MKTIKIIFFLLSDIFHSDFFLINSKNRGDNLRNESLRRWHDEMVGMREALQHFSYASFDEIVGIRAPYFQFGGVFF